MASKRDPAAESRLESEVTQTAGYSADESQVDTICCQNCGTTLTVSRSHGRLEECPKCGGVLVTVSYCPVDLTATKDVVALPIGDPVAASIADAPQAPDDLPETIGPYGVIAKLGQGAFGVVYRARHLERDQEVAIKVARTDRVHRSGERRHLANFVLEGRKTLNWRHPGIVTVVDVADGDGETPAYVAMEFVQGGTLAERLRDGWRPRPSESLRLVRDVAEAVHQAHLRGLVHRDLKPSNILLTARGKPKVADFGLAIDEDEQLSLEGQVAGTLPYMSPEQVLGRTHHLDGRTDVWSLGVILYELLAGRRPFEGNQRQLRDAILEKPIRPLSQRGLLLPAELDEILARCLDKAPERRYPTAAHLRDALNRILRRHHLKYWAVAGLGGIGTAALLSRRFTRASQGPIEELVGTQRWVNVPVGEPDKSYWPYREPLAELYHDLQAGSLTVDTQNLALLGLGETLSTNWLFEADLSLAGRDGWGGFFLGLRDATRADFQGRTFQLLAIVYLGLPPKLRRYLRRQVISLEDAGRGNIRERQEQPQQVRLPDHLQDVENLRFQIEFRGGFLHRLICNGSEFPELTKYHPPARALDIAWPPATGKFGILNYFNETTVRNGRVNVTRNPTPG